MNYSQEKQYIEEFFGTNWTETSVVYENGTPPAEDEWVRLSIQNGDAFQASMGDNPDFRYIGVVFVQVFTKKGIGSGRAIAIADIVSSLFRIAVVNGIVFKVPQIQRMPDSLESEWYQVNVSVDFYRG